MTRQIIGTDGTAYYLAVDALWEEDETVWLRDLVEQGVAVRDVRRVIYEGRGRLLVEFLAPTSMAEAKKVLEAGTKAGDSATEGNFYRVTKDIVVRSRTWPNDTPTSLTKGTEIKCMESTSNGQWVFEVRSGRFKDHTIYMNQHEWLANTASLLDVGTELTRGRGGDGDLEMTEPDEVEPLSVDGAGPKGPYPGLTPPRKRTKKKGFPDFPPRKPLSSYMVKKKK